MFDCLSIVSGDAPEGLHIGLCIKSVFLRLPEKMLFINLVVIIKKIVRYKYSPYVFRR